MGSSQMINSLQGRLRLEVGDSLYINTPPKGYKGLSGFHKYWGKKPIEAWRFLIENFTEPSDIVLDPFIGSGLIAKECIDKNRRFIGFDINPISIELTKLYLEPPSYTELKSALLRVEENAKTFINEMYLLPDGNIATHLLWNKDSISKVWTKTGRRRVEVNLSKSEVSRLEQVRPYKPKYIRDLRLFDNSRINSKRDFSITDLISPRALRAIDLLKSETAKYNGPVQRALLLILSSSLGQMSKMVFAVSNRRKSIGAAVNKIEVGSWVIGYWRPDQHFEINSWNCYENKAKKLLQSIHESRDQKCSSIASTMQEFLYCNNDAYMSVGDSETLLKNVLPNSVQVVLTDPPHGDRIPYLELSEMWNSVIGLDSNYEEELVVSNAKGRRKNVPAYNEKPSLILEECICVLKEGGLLGML